MKTLKFKYFTAGTDRPQLRLILKVGGASTPDLVDHGDSSSGMSNRPGIVNLPYGTEEDSRQSSLFSLHDGSEKEKHKKTLYVFTYCPKMGQDDTKQFISRWPQDGPKLP